MEQLHLKIHRYIDHTLVKADARPKDIDHMCVEAKKYNFAAVAVNPHYVKRCAEQLKGTSTVVVCAVGFPFGATTSNIKAAEAAEAIANGASEIDMVINIGELISGNDNIVLEDIQAVVAVAQPHNIPVKVIIEADLLTDDEKTRACQAAYKAGANYIKTSTGTRSGGATEADVHLILESVEDKLQVKASGGIRSWETAKRMVAAGATRLGTSSGTKIVEEAFLEANAKANKEKLITEQDPIMGGMMQAAVYHGPKDLRIKHVTKPAPGPGEVLIRVKSSVICATDIKMFSGIHSYVETDKMVIFGHENAGYIAELGSGVEGYSIGEAVFVAPNIGCGQCYLCINGNNNICRQSEQIGMSLNGGFAEYLLVPKRAVQQGNLLPIKDGVDLAVASLTEPLACVLRGQKPLQISPDKVVLIMGGGPIGMLHLKLAQLKSAAKIIVTEPNAFRRTRATEFGADCVVDPFKDDLASVVNKESNGHGADVIITAVSSAKAQADSIELAAIGGRICFFAGLPKGITPIQLDSNLLHYKELVVSGTSGNSTANCNEAMSIINAGKIDLSCMITGRFPLTEIHTAFGEAQKSHTLKIAIEP